MPRRPPSSAGRLLASILLVGACVSTSTFDGPLRAAADAPDHFLVGRHGGGETHGPRAGEGCRNPMVDPRDGTRITLVASGEQVGHYAVPPGRYGVEAGEVLRLDCSTGRVLGIARR